MSDFVAKGQFFLSFGLCQLRPDGTKGSRFQLSAGAKSEANRANLKIGSDLQGESDSLIARTGGDFNVPIKKAVLRVA